MQTLQPIVSNISKEDMIHFRNKYIKVASYQFTTLIVVGILIETRRHSSGMRTARLLPVSTSMHCFRGVYLPRGCTCSGGVPAPGEYLPRGVGTYLGSVHAQVLPPHCGQTDTCKNITIRKFRLQVVNI